MKIEALRERGTYTAYKEREKTLYTRSFFANSSLSLSLRFSARPEKVIKSLSCLSRTSARYIQYVKGSFGPKKKRRRNRMMPWTDRYLFFTRSVNYFSPFFDLVSNARVIVRETGAFFIILIHALAAREEREMRLIPQVVSQKVIFSLSLSMQSQPS